MHTLSSASRTCMASASAVECTAPVAPPSSLQARSTRRAISPRLAIRILSNIAPRSALLDHRKRLAIFNRLAVLDEDRDDRAGAGGGNLVHCLHGFDDEQRLPRGDMRADFDERRRTRLRRAIGGPDHRRGHGAGRDDDIIRTRLGRPRFGDRPRRGFARLRLAAVGSKRGREVHPARDSDPLAFVLDLDLGEASLLKQRRELANEVLVKGGLFLRHRRRPLPFLIDRAWRRSWRRAPRWQVHSSGPLSRRSRPSQPWRYRSFDETARG